MTTKNSLSFAEMKTMSFHELREAIWQGMSEQNRRILAERYGENLELGLTLLVKDYLDGAKLNVEYRGLPEDEQHITFDEFVPIYLHYVEPLAIYLHFLEKEDAGSFEDDEDE